MELDADEPQKFQGPPDRILGQPTWVGGWGREKRRFSLEKRSERPWPLWGRGEYVPVAQWHRVFFALSGEEGFAFLNLQKEDELFVG